jgi:hypothetical protein
VALMTINPLQEKKKPADWRVFEEEVSGLLI